MRSLAMFKMTDKAQKIRTVTTTLILLSATIFLSTCIEAPVPPPWRVDNNPSLLYVDEEVQESMLIRKVQPVYPPMARTVRMQGIVVLYVLVDEEGYVVEVHVHSGSALLRQAAVDAVRQWRYAPALLDNEPTAVETKVRIAFYLDDHGSCHDCREDCIF